MCRRIALIMVFLSTVFLCQCTSLPPPSNRSILRIALLADFSGSSPHEHHGIELCRGVEASRQHLPKHVELEFSQFDIGDGVDLLRISTKLNEIVNQGIQLVLGPVTSEQAFPAIQYASENDLNLLFILPTATSNRLTRQFDNVVRTCFDNAHQAFYLSSYVTSLDPPATRVVTLSNGSSEYSLDLAREFQRHLGALGGRVVEEIFYNPAAPDFPENSLLALQDLGESAYDAIFVADHEISGEVMLALIQGGLPQPRIWLGADGWIGGDNGATFLTSLMKAEIEGICVGHWPPTQVRGLSRKFLFSYKKLFNREPGVISALSYDATLFLADLLADNLSLANMSANVWRTKIVFQDRDFVGATGRIRYHGTPDPQKQAFLVRTNGSAFLDYRVIGRSDSFGRTTWYLLFLSFGIVAAYRIHRLWRYNQERRQDGLKKPPRALVVLTVVASLATIGGFTIDLIERVIPRHLLAGISSSLEWLRGVHGYPIPLWAIFSFFVAWVLLEILVRYTFARLATNGVSPPSIR